MSISSASKSNRAVQDLDFYFMERLKTAEAVSVHALNENKGNSVLPRKMKKKKNSSKNLINHSVACTLKNLIFLFNFCA